MRVVEIGVHRFPLREDPGAPRDQRLEVGLDFLGGGGVGSDEE